MGTLFVIAASYLLFWLPIAVGGLFVWFFCQRRMRPGIADWLLFVLPWTIWLALTALGGEKSVSNLAFEAIMLGVVSLMFLCVRAVFAMTRPQGQAIPAIAALVGSCLAAVIMWAVVPGLPFE